MSCHASQNNCFSFCCCAQQPGTPPHHLSFFVLEPRSEFFLRCQRSVDCLHERYIYKPRQVLVMVSHAAGCIALAKTFTQQTLQDITPAGPCSIYRLTRTSDTSVWTLDPHNKPQGMNGYTEHLSEMGSATVPWNNFGDGTTKFYTGPPTSRFAPQISAPSTTKPHDLSQGPHFTNGANKVLPMMNGVTKNGLSHLSLK